MFSLVPITLARLFEYPHVFLPLWKKKLCKQNKLNVILIGTSLRGHLRVMILSLFFGSLLWVSFLPAFLASCLLKDTWVACFLALSLSAEEQLNLQILLYISGSLPLTEIVSATCGGALLWQLVSFFSFFESLLTRKWGLTGRPNTEDIYGELNGSALYLPAQGRYRTGVTGVFTPYQQSIITALLHSCHMNGLLGWRDTASWIGEYAAALKWSILINSLTWLLIQLKMRYSSNRKRCILLIHAF